MKSLKNSQIRRIQKKVFIYVAFITGILFAAASAHALVATVIGALAGAAFFFKMGMMVTVGGSLLFSAGAGTIGALIAGAALGAIGGSAMGLPRALTPDLPEVGKDSPNYKEDYPKATVQEGTPVPLPYGRTLAAGNIVRQNDAAAADYIEFIICHGRGTVDKFLGHWINGVEWTDLRNGNHARWAQEGESNQSGVTHLFSDAEASNYRGYALTEVRLAKGDEIRGLDNIYAVGLWRECLEIGQDAGGSKSWTRNPAKIIWDHYITQEGYAASELDSNAFTALESYCDNVPSDDSQPIRPTPVSDDMVTEAARTASWQYKAKWALRKDKSLTGEDARAAWKEEATTNKRINIDFSIAQVIDKMRLENYHNSGADTDVGIQNFVIQGSNNPASFADTSYASTGWTDLLTDSASQHAASDASDPEEFTISNSTAYRYYAIKMADNHGDGNYMGFRDLTFYGKQPRYTFDFVFDTNIEKVDALKIMWDSFNGKTIDSQGTIKPVWDAAQMHDGAGGLTTKSSSFSFDEDNIVPGSFTWGRLKRPNIVRIHFRDSADNFKKTSVELRDDKDINDRGEIVHSETCWYITERSVALRRCKYKFDKARYTDHACRLTGDPSSQAIEIYDRVDVTDPKGMWTAKDFVVIEKDEDQYGRPMFYLEEYNSGIYNDDGFEVQPGYRSHLPHPSEVSPPSTIHTLANITTGTKHSYGSISVKITPPNWPHYSKTKVFGSNDDSTFYYVGETDGGKDLVINGMGTLYQPGDTVYIRLVNVNANGTQEPFPTSSDGQIVTASAVRLGSFYAGDTDLWGGNAALGNAATTIVLGDLADTPKIAIGTTTADSMTLANMATHPGFYADATGDCRFGGNGGGAAWDQSESTFTVEGILQASEIHIPDKDSTASSFHVQTDGDTWWGCTETNFNADNNNATAYILKTGAAKFQSVTLSDNVILSGLQAGSDIDGQYLTALSVDTAAIAALAIETDKIDNLAITAGKIDAAAVETAKIKDLAVTGGKIEAGAIDTGHLANLAVTAGKIDNLTITAAQIANLTITGGAAGKIATSTITEDNIVANTITAASIAANTITAAEIATGTITASEIAANTITAAEISAGAIDTSELAANAVTASEINGGAFGALTISSGSITFNATDSIQIQAAQGMKVLAGADIYLVGHASNAGTIVCDGTTQGVIYGAEAAGTSAGFHPSGSGVGTFGIGWDFYNNMAYPFNVIYMYADAGIVIENRVGASSNRARLSLASGHVELGTLDAGWMTELDMTDTAITAIVNTATVLSLADTGLTMSAGTTITMDGNILMTDTDYIGISSAERVEFYAVGYVAVMGAKLGIRIASPQSILHVHDVSSGAVYAQFTNITTGSGDASQGLAVGISATEVAYLWNYENTNMILGTNNGAAITIDTSQNVTIAGTLTVDGDQTGATDHVFDDFDDIALLYSWRKGEGLPFNAGDILNRDRLLRDAMLQFYEEQKEILSYLCIKTGMTYADALAAARLN